MRRAKVVRPLALVATTAATNLRGNSSIRAFDDFGTGDANRLMLGTRPRLR